jgi:hypothetical protein
MKLKKLFILLLLNFINLTKCKVENTNQSKCEYGFNGERCDGKLINKRYHLF